MKMPQRKTVSSVIDALELVCKNLKTLRANADEDKLKTVERTPVPSFSLSDKVGSDITVASLASVPVEDNDNNSCAESFSVLSMT